MKGGIAALNLFPNIKFEIKRHFSLFKFLPMMVMLLFHINNISV
jgi:hypothetical protein